VNKAGAARIKADAEERGARSAYITPVVREYNHPEDEWKAVVQYAWNQREEFYSVAAYRQYMGGTLLSDPVPDERQQRKGGRR